MEGWSDLLGKEIKVFFNDLKGVSFREGILKSVNESAIFLQTMEGIEVIALSMFIRVIFKG